MESEGLEPKSYSFLKDERLRSRKTISKIFASKSSDFTFPFKFFYLPTPNLKYNQVLVSIPKKQFKRSVDRHLLGRRIKEAYRLNKHLLNNNNHKYCIVYIYVGKELLSFKEIEKKLYLTLQRINNNDHNVK